MTSETTSLIERIHDKLVGHEDPNSVMRHIVRQILFCAARRELPEIRHTNT
jgi:hypothetical protein